MINIFDSCYSVSQQIIINFDIQTLTIDQIRINAVKQMTQPVFRAVLSGKDQGPYL